MEITSGIDRCKCSKNYGEYREIDKVNFDKPVECYRCNKCKGLLRGYYVW